MKAELRKALVTEQAIKTMVGKVYDDLTVIGLAGVKGEHRLWECRCKCGATAIKSSDTLGRKNVFQACNACVRRRNASIEDLSGSVYGFLTVLFQDGLNEKNRMVYSCGCSCGAVVHMTKEQLQRVQSCRKCSFERTRPARSAANTKHGHSDRRVNGKKVPGSPTYQSWLSMKQRMTNPNSDSFGNYGAILTIDPRWMKFENFLADMGPRPENTSIDRIENNEGYYKQNCRWATRLDQNRNRKPLRPFSEWKRKPAASEPAAAERKAA